MASNHLTGKKHPEKANSGLYHIRHKEYSHPEGHTATIANITNPGKSHAGDYTVYGSGHAWGHKDYKKGDNKFYGNFSHESHAHKFLTSSGYKPTGKIKEETNIKNEQIMETQDLIQAISDRKSSAVKEVVGSLMHQKTVGAILNMKKAIASTMFANEEQKPTKKTTEKDLVKLADSRLKKHADIMKKIDTKSKKG